MEKNSEDNCYYLVKNYGMKGSDVFFCGTAKECDAYLEGMLEVLNNMLQYN